MRFWNLLKNELRFNLKYGILFLYLFLTILYVIFLTSMPENAKQLVGAILIFTVPAAMGLFFMGAIMLLEKSQRMNHALSVTPVKISEYIGAKSLALLIIGTLAGIIMGLAAKVDVTGVFFSVVLSSFLFSTCAMVVSVKTESLNSFMIGIVPIEIIICAPAILYLFGILHSNYWIFHPGVSAIILLQDSRVLWPYAICSLLFWNVIIFAICHKTVRHYMQHLGGGTI